MRTSLNPTEKQFIFFAFSCIFMIMSQCSFAQLNGTYSIDPGVAASSKNYKNIKSAISDMVSGKRSDGGTANGSGVSGAVVFKIADNTYTGPFMIDRINGTSSSNTVTFQSKSGDSSKVILTYPADSSGYNNYTVQLYGASWIIFKQITIQRTGVGTDGIVVDFDNQCCNNTFTGCKISGITTNLKSEYLSIIHSYYQEDTNNTFKGNLIRNGSYGFYLYGAGTYYESGYQILNNTIDSFGYIGIFFEYNTNITISSNTIQNPHSALIGIYIVDCIGTGSIVKNRIIFTSGGSPIELFSFSGTSTSYQLVANNFISLSGSSYGIYTNGCKYVNFYYNTIYACTPNSSAYCGYFISPDYCNIKNNIFANNGGSNACAYRIYPTTNLGTSDNNDVYVSAGAIAYYLDLNKYTTPAKVNASYSSFEGNSISADPFFKDSLNLHVANVLLNGAATPFAGVTDDIDGQTRSTSTPDIGADEFTPFVNDAGILSIDSLKQGVCPGTKQSVYALLTNNGSNTLTSATINWKVNNLAQTSYSWTGSLSPGTSTEVNFGTFTYPNTTISYGFKVYSSSPNGSTDSFSVNDTLIDSVIIKKGPSATVGSPVSFCKGTSSSTSVGASSVSGNTYSWTSNPTGFTSTSSNPSVNPTVTTTYILTEVMTSTGCSRSDSVKITINPLPVPTTGSAQTICSGTSTSIGGSATAGHTYRWTSNPIGFTSTSSNPIVSPISSTTYYLTEKNSSTGCADSDSVQISTNPIPAAATGSAVSVCIGASASIGASPVGSNTYSWTSNPGGFTSTSSKPTVTPSSTTVYRLTETIPSTGCSKTDSVVITVNPLPAAATGPDSSVCFGSSITIGNTAVVGDKYYWTSNPAGFSSISSNPGVSPTIKTIYYLTDSVTATGCTKSDSVIISINALPSPSFATIGTVCSRSTVTYSTTNNAGSTYKWNITGGVINSGSTSSSVNVSWGTSTAGALKVIETNASTCSDSFTSLANIDTACVWPGDANNDKVVDINDALNIGLLMGLNGPERIGATTTWIGQHAADWKNPSGNPINSKYSDCDGDSTIAYADTNSIVKNYSNVHLKKFNINQGNPTDPHLSIKFSGDSAQAGDLISADIIYGDASIPASNIYGLAFSINYPDMLLDTAFLDFSSSWLETKPVSLGLMPQTGQLDIAVVRTNQKDTTGYGKLATLYFKVKNSLPRKSNIFIATLGNNKQINAKGNIIPVYLRNDSLKIEQTFTGIHTSRDNALMNLAISPNPFRDRTNIEYKIGYDAFVKIAIYSADGRLVSTLLGNKQEAGKHGMSLISGENMPAGVYFLRMMIDEKVITKQIIILQ